MYTFKVIDSNISNKELTSNGIKAGNGVFAGLLVGDVLKTIRREDSPFISVKKNFLGLVDSINISKGSYDNKRDNVLVMDGFGPKLLKVKTFYSNGHSVSDLKKVPVYAMESFILDCSTKESISELESKGLVNSRSTSKVCIDDGMLVFDHINPDKIVTVLEPLQIDSLYALLFEYGEEKKNIQAFINFVGPNIISDSSVYDLSESEKVLFDAMFIQNKPLISIAKEIVEENKVRAEFVRKEDENVVSFPDPTKDLIIFNYDGKFDVLNIISYLKNKKRVILDKIFKKAGFNVNSVRLIEDELNIARFGKVKQEDSYELSYNGVTLIIPALNYFETLSKVDPFTITHSALMGGNIDEMDDNQRLLDNAYLEEKNKQVLKKTSK